MPKWRITQVMSETYRGQYRGDIALRVYSLRENGGVIEHKIHTNATRQVRDLMGVG